MSDRAAGALSGGDPRPQSAAAELPRAREAAARPKATTRSAAIASRVYLRVDDDVITDVSFQGSGCAISKASASLMTESVKGKTIAQRPKRCSSAFSR